MLTVRTPGEEEPAQVDLGETTLHPEVVLQLDADTAHRFWLGQLNAAVALANGDIRTRGPVAKVLGLVPLVKPGFPRYRTQLEAAGREDLLERPDGGAGQPSASASARWRAARRGRGTSSVSCAPLSATAGPRRRTARR